MILVTRVRRIRRRARRRASWDWGETGWHDERLRGYVYPRGRRGRRGSNLLTQPSPAGQDPGMRPVEPNATYFRLSLRIIREIPFSTKKIIAKALTMSSAEHKCPRRDTTREKTRTFRWCRRRRWFQVSIHPRYLLWHVCDPNDVERDFRQQSLEKTRYRGWYKPVPLVRYRFLKDEAGWSRVRECVCSSEREEKRKKNTGKLKGIFRAVIPATEYLFESLELSTFRARCLRARPSVRIGIRRYRRTMRQSGGASWGIAKGMLIKLKIFKKT